MELYTAQHNHYQQHGAFATSLQALGIQNLNPAAVTDVNLQATDVSFVASAAVPPPTSSRGVKDGCAAGRAVGGGWPVGDRGARMYVGVDGRLVMAFPGGDGGLAYHPEHGGSRWC